jgi:RND family efflux transporter MFP subunit
MNSTTMTSTIIKTTRIPQCLSVLAAIFVLSACQGEQDKASTEQKGSNKVTQISVTQVQSQNIALYEESVGTLEGVIDPTIAAEISARVVQVLVHPGQPVKKGQVIAILDATDFGLQRQEAQSEVARMQALIANQHKVVERNRALVEKNFISKNALDDANTQLNALHQQLEGAKSRVATISHNGAKNRVVAPTDGVIEKQIVSNGDFVRIGDPIVQIINNSVLRAHLPFPERVAAKLKPGLTVKLTTPTSSKEVMSTIKELHPLIAANNRSIDVVAEIRNEPDWQAGASVNGKVVLGQRDAAIVVPEQSVVLRPAGEVIYVIQKNKAGQLTAFQRVVKTGIAERGNIEILEGLSGGESIAVDGAAFLTDKTAVKVGA